MTDSMHNFTEWARRLFPGFDTDPQVHAHALAEWSVELQIRALVDEGISRGDAQAVVEAGQL